MRAGENHTTPRLMRGKGINNARPKRLVPQEWVVWNWRRRSPMFQHNGSMNHWGWRRDEFYLYGLLL
jgi:hypothetical protein